MPLKIFQFITTLGGGGAETMLCNLNAALAARGVETGVVATTVSGCDHSRLDRILRTSRFHLLETNSLKSPRFLMDLAVLLRRERPDVFHTWMHSSGLIAGAVAKAVGVPRVVWAVHSSDLLCSHGPSCRQCPAFGRVLGLASHFIPDVVVSCSATGARIHRDHYGYDARRLQVIPNGIDTEVFRPRPEACAITRARLGIPPEAPVIGMMTRQHPVKDLPTFLRAAALLQRSVPEARFVISGILPDEPSPELRELAAALPAPSHLHWAGYAADPPAVYAAFDLFCVSSISEAYPMVLIEALACGIPCVSTDVGDARLIVGDGGSVVPPSRPDALAAAWEHHLRQAPVPPELCRRRAVDHFGLDACCARYLEVYHAPRLPRSPASHVFSPAHPAPHHGS